MTLYDKIRQRIDWNNVYTIQKTLNILNSEFELALKKNNTRYIMDIISITQKLYDDFSTSYCESSDLGETMSYNQKVMASKMRTFIAYLVKKVNSKTKSLQIKQIIDNGGKQ